MFTVAQRVEWAVEAVTRAFTRSESRSDLIKFEDWRLMNALRVNRQSLTTDLMREFENALLRDGYQHVILADGWHAVINVNMVEEQAVAVSLI